MAHNLNVASADHIEELLEVHGDEITRHIHVVVPHVLDGFTEGTLELCECLSALALGI